MFRNHTEFVKRHNTDQLLYISNRGVNIIQFRCIQSSECWTCTLYRVVYLWEGKEKSHTQWRILCYFFISAEFLRRILFIYCNIFPNLTSELWKPDIYIYIFEMKNRVYYLSLILLLKVIQILFSQIWESTDTGLTISGISDSFLKNNN